MAMLGLGSRSADLRAKGRQRCWWAELLGSSGLGLDAANVLPRTAAHAHRGVEISPTALGPCPPGPKDPPATLLLG